MHSLTKRASACFLTSLCLATVTSARADEVWMKNGDRLTGAIVRKADDTLILRTDYAGEIRLRWSQVEGISTDQPVEVLLTDDVYLRARLEAVGQSRVALEGQDTPVARGMPLERIAYINPSPEQSGRGMTFKGRVQLAAAQTSGNTDTERLNGETEMTLQAKRYRYILGGDANQEKDDGRTSASNWRGHTSFDWFFRPRQFLYTRATFEHDEFKDLKLRSSFGGGYGYQVFETETTRLSIQGGLNRVNVDRIATDDESYPAAGWLIRFEHKLWGGPMTLFHVQDGEGSLEDAGDLVVRTKTGLRWPLAGGLNATAQLNLDWDNDPAPGRKSKDQTLLLGLGYEW
jgi:hypothetical protein